MILGAKQTASQAGGQGDDRGERSPIRCKEDLDRALTQPSLLCLSWMAGGSGGTQLWVSVFIQDFKSARLHRQLTDYDCILVIGRQLQ